ncbi:unnamed protein product [Nezara viridula]|uniref:Odorant receptor n=1 Tax=Nezara viridula TaxID=85310 RepID=A0A9P0EB65_NEZVI|nr:unnamed protein product [Nezara viridula]
MWTAEAITIHIGSETLVFILMMYTKLELKMINYRLIIIKNNLNGKESNHQINTEKLLWEVIQRHQRTLEVLNVMKDTLGLPLAIHYTSVSLTLSVIFYCLMTFDERGSLTAKFNGVTAIICIGSLLFALCYFGESLEEENAEINKRIYDLPWYNETICVKRTVIIMLRQTQKPFVINYRLTAQISLKTFMQVSYKKSGLIFRKLKQFFMSF